MVLLPALPADLQRPEDKHSEVGSAKQPFLRRALTACAVDDACYSSEEGRACEAYEERDLFTHDRTVDALLLHS